MRELVLGKVVTCELDGEATYDRCAAICYLESSDISEEMVRMGLARDCPRYSGGRYRAAEQQAADGAPRSGRAIRCPATARRGDRWPR